MAIILDGTNGITTPDLESAGPVTGTTATFSGNVGVGTTSPVNIAGYKSVTVSSTTGGWLEVTNGTVRGALQNGSGDVTLETRSAHPLIFGVNGTERARIDSSGNLLVGRTSQISGSPYRLVVDGGGAYGNISCYRPSTSFQGHIEFFNPNGSVGLISTTASATTYSTSSDYRLKDDVQPMVGALSVVQQLKPCTYKWKVDGSDGQGFIAHELQAIVPDAVVGEKDAVDAEGNPRYQGIDTSFLVATLTAAIQEQQAIITALTARVVALEGTQP